MDLPGEEEGGRGTANGFDDDSNMCYICLNPVNETVQYKPLHLTWRHLFSLGACLITSLLVDGFVQNAEQKLSSTEIKTIAFHKRNPDLLVAAAVVMSSLT